MAKKTETEKPPVEEAEPAEPTLEEQLAKVAEDQKASQDAYRDTLHE